MLFMRGVINLSYIPQGRAFDLLPEAVREQLIDTIVSAHDQAVLRQDFERKVYRAHSHLSTPGILSMVECPIRGRLAVFARALGLQPAFWFQRGQTNVAEVAGTLSDLVDRMVQGGLPLGWQNQPV
jgi:hypothetical protein